MKVLSVLLLVMLLLVVMVLPASAAAPGQSPEEAEGWFSQFMTASIEGTPIFLVIFIVVEALKQLKAKDGQQLLSGNAILLTSMIFGLIMGIGYSMWRTEPPAEGYAVFQYWFAASVFGLLMGGAAAVFYDRIKAMIFSTLEKLLKKYQGPVL